MNREQWLNALVRELLPMFEEVQKGSTATSDTWRVSCGFPGGGSARKRIGECWSESASAAAHTEMFISPVLSAADEVDHVLVHEMVHAAVGVSCGHKGPFKSLATRLGLVGKMTATTAGPELRKRLDSITARLPPYPHSRLNLSERKKQTTRLLKIECSSCGYTCRTTQKWVDFGLPTCACGGEFQLGA